MMEEENFDERSTMYFSMTPNGFPRAYQTKSFTVKEFMEGSFKTDQLLRKMAGKLNSNESFDSNQTFEMDLIVLAPKPTGSGNGKRLNPGQMGYKVSRQTKQSIVEIKNKDTLCCARAIVTMQARSEWKVLEKQLKEEQAIEIPDPHLLERLQREEKFAEKHYDTLRHAKGQTTLQLKFLKLREPTRSFRNTCFSV